VSTALHVLIGLLLIDTIIEVAFISSTVAWLRSTARHKAIFFVYNGGVHILSGLPRDLITSQQHMSNGAAVTVFAIVGLGGIVSLRLRNRNRLATDRVASFARGLYYLWLYLHIPALLLTIGALVYVFVVTNPLEGQIIDRAFAVKLIGRPYPRHTWTPQNWFSAVLRLRLKSGREEIQRHLAIMRAGEYNLIPSKYCQKVFSFFLPCFSVRLWILC
jgi:hypothetical protein